ncbi:hypothetical protein GA0061098_1002475 [Bradyrhizobium shewense]|uniref:Uncharacterized protein n=1 Tax=Bradyrhizobium shewense TaxID=1761772 RepID=A0A1C3UVC7_9BRAD|nr:hypothetical protein GA0061098_1002475 [Bradyrhizobium shewense]
MPPFTPSLRGALATKQSRVFPRWDFGLLPPSPRLRRTSRYARNDGGVSAPQPRLSCPGRSAASLRRCAAEPGPMPQRSPRRWVPALRSSVRTLQCVRATSAPSPPGLRLTHFSPRHRHRQPERLGQHGRSRRRRDLHRLRPSRRPQRFRNLAALRWLRRNLELGEAVTPKEMPDLAAERTRRKPNSSHILSGFAAHCHPSL